MARAYGNSPLTHLLIKFQTDAGTSPGGNFRKMPFVSVDLSASQDLIPSDLIGQGRGPRDPSLDLMRVSGEIVVPNDARTAGYWLRAALGTPVSWADTPSASVYTHYFGMDGATLPMLAIEIGLGQVPAYYLYLGCRVNTIRGDVTRTGLSVLRIGISGQSETQYTSSQGGTPVLPPASARFANRQGNIQREGADLASVLTGDWTIDNKLVAVETVRDDDYVEDFDPGDSAFAGNINTRFASTALVDDAVAGTPKKVAFIYTIDAGNILTVQARRVFLPRPKRSISGPGGVEAPFAWQAAHADLEAPTNLVATKSAGGSLEDDEYFYVVTAVDVNGDESVACTEDSATTSASDNTVTLEWDAVDGALSYNIYRALATDTYGVASRLATAVTALTYDDDGSVVVKPAGLAAAAASGGTLADDEYFYVVTGVDGDGNESVQSVEDSATTSLTDNTVALTWTALAGAVTYKVYRSDTTGVYGASSLLKSGVATNAYNDTGADSLVSGTPPAVSAFLGVGAPPDESEAGHTAEVILVNDVANFTIA